MTILITGGEGFIGSHMVSFLKKLGHSDCRTVCILFQYYPLLKLLLLVLLHF